MKLPHWAQLLLGLAVVVITWVMQQASAGNLVLPAVVVTVLTIAKTAIGMFTDSVQSARAAARAMGKLSAILLLVFVGRSLSACFGQSAVQPTADFAACVTSAALSGDSISQIVQSCGGDAAAVIVALLTNKNPDVPGSKAFAEALSARSVLMQSLDGGVGWKSSP